MPHPVSFLPTGQSSCAQCGLGHFSASSGAVTCDKCPQGRFNNFPNQPACTAWYSSLCLWLRLLLGYSRELIMLLLRTAMLARSTTTPASCPACRALPVRGTLSGCRQPHCWGCVLLQARSSRPLAPPAATCARLVLPNITRWGLLRSAQIVFRFAGSASSGKGSSLCVPCSVGRFADKTGAQQCGLCPKGESRYHTHTSASLQSSRSSSLSPMLRLVRRVAGQSDLPAVPGGLLH